MYIYILARSSVVLRQEIKSPDTKCGIKSSRSIPKTSGCSGAPLMRRRDFGCTAKNKAVKQHRETTLSLREPSMCFKGEGKGSVMKGLGALLYFKKCQPGPEVSQLTIFAVFFLLYFFVPFFFQKDTKAGQGIE